MSFDFNTLAPEHVRILEALVPGRSAWVPRIPIGLPSVHAVRAEAAEVQRFMFRPWDLAIRPDGDDYIFRWHIIPRRSVGANGYLHLQVASDPERPLHDHPWDNQSVLLAGGYREVYVERPAERWLERERIVREGQTVHRRAEEAHRLFMLPGVPYTISLFSTGPVVRDWGFWFVHPDAPNWTDTTPRRWRSHEQVIVNERFIGEP